MPYRFSATTALVTWPQCPVEHDTFYDALRAKDPLAEFRLAIEHHEDGNTHFHAYIVWPRKQNKRDPAWLDVLGYHPNIQAAKNPRAACDYVSKEGHYKDSNNFLPPSSLKKWSDLVAAATLEDFWRIARETSPRDFILQNERLEYYAAKYYQKTTIQYTPDPTHQFQMTPDLLNWRQNEFDSQVP